ncbi:IS110 family transposase [Mesorhizobium sp. L48C026A00]|uniref:IS110 family transposase n=1 Tax=Mesorhizobium sp. L48C026A00 TaxID=1287182 RepID=UPI0003D05076|nr:IS110 family transposase [Mesorhizobium sp. L48C026A00]ESZ22717.1 transposase IS110 [Mesorhizobium sp. L48C026A00]
MNNTIIIGIDLAKNVFQLHGMRADGSVAFRRKVSRARLLPFLAEHPACLVAMEACASAHYWGREIGKLGHEVRLIAPQYVKPFVKRQKNDVADAEAIAEAASRPTMRFVAVKSAEKQSQAMVFKTRDLLMAQRTQTINALRGHLAEYGVIAPQGPQNIGQLAEALDDPETSLPPAVVDLGRELLNHLATLDDRIGALSERVKEIARTDETARRLMAIPGIGPICAAAMAAVAPPPSTFTKGRDFAAWLGLTPKQNSTGGKTRLGKTSKMGQRDLRRLLILGAMAVVQRAARRGATAGSSWLARMLARKPKMLVAVALANKIARVAWALMASGGVYQAPAAA